MTSEKLIPKLHIKVLGTVSVSLDGVEITDFRSAKVLALLIYLAVTQEPQRRASLAAHLWPDSSEQNASSSLRNAIATLRKIVPDYLHVDRGAVALKVEHLWLDSSQFTKLLQRTGDALEDARRQQTALSFYRGDFLAGFHVAGASPFEEWAGVIREQVRQHAASAMIELARWHVAQADYGAGLSMLTHLLDLQPDNEVAHRLKIRCLADTGQRAAALTHYDTFRRFLADEFGVDPDPETQHVFHLLLDGEIKEQQALPASQAVADTVSPARSDAAHYPQIDWGDMPGRTPFYGRLERLMEGAAWLTKEDCSLIVICGMGGVGKTAFAAELIHRLASLPVGDGGYERIVWRTLINAPSLTEVLDDWLHLLVVPPPEHLPSSLDGKLTAFFRELQSQRCLLVLDNAESIMDGTGSGYRSGFADYRQLVERMAHGRHQSCLLMTTRVQPKELEQFPPDYGGVRVVTLSGLALNTGADLLRASGLESSESTLTSLAARYSGNPLALKMIAATIRNLYAGRIDSFLNDETLIFDDTRDVLDQQFDRLSKTAQEVLIWLAVARQPVSLAALREFMVEYPAQRVVVEAVRELQRASLISDTESAPPASAIHVHQSADDQATSVMVQNVVMEYVTDRFIHTLHRELQEGQSDSLHRFALRKATDAEYVQAIQRRLFLEPLGERLVRQVGRPATEQLLIDQLELARSSPRLSQGYIGANVLHLMQQLEFGLDHRNLSRLCFREADLRGVSLHSADFSGANFVSSRFADSFGSVMSVDVSPGGQFMAAGAGRTVVVWQLNPLQTYAVFNAHLRPIVEVAFAPDSRHLASASFDGSIFIWDVLARKEVRRLKSPVHEGDLNSTAFSPDGETLAGGGHSGHIDLWNWRTGEQLESLLLDKRIPRLHFAPTGELLACVGYHGEVQGWAISEQRLLFTLVGDRSLYAGPTSVVAGNTWILSNQGDAIQVWDRQTEELSFVLRGHSAWVESLALSPDERLVASAGADNVITLWDMHLRQPLRHLEGHQGTVRGLAFTPDGLQLVSGGYDEAVRVWATQTGLEESTLQGYASWPLIMDFSPDGQTLAVATPAGTVHLYEGLELRRRQILQGHNSAVRMLQFSRDALLLATAGDDGCVCVWDVQSGKRLHALTGHDGFVRVIAFDHAGRFIASGGHDATIRVWDMASGALVQVIPNASANSYKGMAFSPNDSLLGYGDTSGRFCLYDVDQGRLVASAPMTANANAVAFGAGKPLVACGTYDGSVLVWDVKVDGSDVVLVQRHSFHPSHKCVWRLQFNMDDSLLVWSGESKEVYVGSVEDGEVRYSIPGNHWPTCITFSGDGRHLLTDSAASEVLVWEAKSGDLVRSQSGHRTNLTAIASSPMSSIIASGDSDGTIKLWHIDSGSEVATARLGSPYSGMNVSGATGLTSGQRRALIALGAIEDVRLPHDA